MNKYLERLDAGEDPRVIILEISGNEVAWKQLCGDILSLIGGSVDSDLLFKVDELVERMLRVHQADANLQVQG